MDISNLLWTEPRKELVLSTGGKNERDDAHLAIEMSSFESAFLCGLIRERRPAKIVEVGVSAGGTSALMLKAASLLGINCTLHSIDIFPQYVRDQSKSMGYVVDEYTPQLALNRKLYLGKVASIPMRDIGGGVDFCILDTQHITPGEILDFFAVFPYMSPDAVVVLHDMSRQYDPEYGRNFHRFSNTALFSCVTAEKVVMVDPDVKRPEGLPNITALKINADTRKYIINVFMALTLPWIYIPSPEQMADYLEDWNQFYDAELIDLLKRSANINLRMRGVPPAYHFDASLKAFCNAFS